MGFTTGFVGGLTSTYALLYITIHLHRQNRLYQSSLLAQQRAVLESLYSPAIQTDDDEAYRVEPAGFVESAKDRWNRSLEANVRSLYEKDWRAERERWEHIGLNLWSKLSDSEAGRRVEKGLEDAKGKVVDGVKELSEQAKIAAKDARRSLEGMGKDVQVESQARSGQKRLLEL